MGLFDFFRALFTPAPVVGVSTTGNGPGAKTLSAAGRAFVEREEGVRLTAYKDTRGILTIGYGHTSGGPAKVPVYAGMVISAAQADALFEADAVPFIKNIVKDLRVPVTQAQFDALFSLEYNIGMSGFDKSSVCRLLNEGKQLSEVAKAFELWAHPPELLGRRQREARLFLRGSYG